MPTYYIHIKGVVQGVGFRPTVYRLANKIKLPGTVSNGTDGVHIYFNAAKDVAQSFYEELLSNIPSRAVVTSATLIKVESRIFSGFKIIESHEGADNSVLLPPDFALCDECRKELYDIKDRRYQYPFITCTLCGPRYSIINGLPYDRPLTTMSAYSMCDECNDEYGTVEDRRYYSQTNSCPDCKINLFIDESHPEVDYIEYILQAWSQDEIVAIKGIGGYLLTCDATSLKAIRKLRERKQRPSKPLAVMYPDFETLRNDLILTEEGYKELSGPVSPIVLCELIDHPHSGLQSKQIAPGLNQIGAMMPYTPLYDLLLSKFKKPIVATSGNLSGDPIEFINNEADTNLSDIVDIFLHNDREIVVPQDDSLIAFTPVGNQKVILRRSRGLAPTYFNSHHIIDPETTILSMGGLLKSTFGLMTQGNIYISQYLGDTDSYNTQVNYQRVLNHILSVTDTKPDKILCDAHPGFFSTQEGQHLSDKWNVELIRVQHHRAHFAAVMGENDLLKPEEEVLGFIWDGVGLGDDNNIWGGELFSYSAGNIVRVDHIPYFKYFLGDKMSREPRLSALALLEGLGLSTNVLEGQFEKKEWKIYHTLLDKYNGVKTSSMGRVFDAVASLVIGVEKQSYEGEAAMMLEAKATKYYRKYIHQIKQYHVETTKDFASIIWGLVSSNETDIEKKAFQFHLDLLGYIKGSIVSLGIGKIAFSGGVFQNRLLVDLIIEHLENDYQLFWHQQLSPNDENISFGQLMHHLYAIKHV